MIGLAAALAFSLSGCSGGLCGGGTLAPFFAKLERARGRDGRPVHILQIGDSHSAGDAITGGWRTLLQGRYGSGGRGVLPPGRPYDGYITHGVTVAMSPGWSVASDFGRSSAEPRPPLGLSAFSLTAAAPGATMAIEAEAGERFDRLVVCALARPGAGRLVLHAGVAEARVELGAANERALCTTVRADAPATHADLATEDGPVTITSWATFLDQGGVAVSNVGVVGSQLVHWARTDDQVIAEEMRAYQPDLIVVAFGTNEGFSPRVQPFEYELTLRAQIGRLRRLAGNVPILLLGAPDALSRQPGLKANAGGGEAAPCEGAPTIAAAASPPAQPGFAGTMSRLSQYLGFTSAAENGAPAPPPPPPPIAPTTTLPAVRPGLFPPPGLAAVREVQGRVAASLHLAYWDWEGRMGGRCAAIGWVRASPPLMRGDYVHYTTAGGRELATRLQADLDAAAGR